MVVAVIGIVYLAFTLWNLRWINFSKSLVFKCVWHMKVSIQNRKLRASLCYLSIKPKNWDSYYIQGSSGKCFQTLWTVEIAVAKRNLRPEHWWQLLMW